MSQTVYFLRDIDYLFRPILCKFSIYLPTSSDIHHSPLEAPVCFFYTGSNFDHVFFLSNIKGQELFFYENRFLGLVIKTYSEFD